MKTQMQNVNLHEGGRSVCSLTPEHVFVYVHMPLNRLAGMGCWLPCQPSGQSSV